MAEPALRQPPTIAETDWLNTLPPAARWVLHGDARVRALAAPVWGVEFPDAPCRAALSGTRAALWLGPDERLLLDFALLDGSSEAARTLSAALERATAEAGHALVDVSHRQFALEVRGAHAETILRGGCPLDLDLSQFPVGMCTRTVFAKADITLWRTREDAFHLEVWRSFAGYVGGLLREIAREFYPA